MNSGFMSYLLRILISFKLTSLLAVLRVQRYRKNWKNSHSRCYTFDARTRIWWLCYSSKLFVPKKLCLPDKSDNHVQSGSYLKSVVAWLQVKYGLNRVTCTLPRIYQVWKLYFWRIWSPILVQFSSRSKLPEMFGQLAQGGTAVGTGLNTKKGYMSFLIYFHI